MSLIYAIRRAHVARQSLTVVRQAADAMNDERVGRMWDDLRSRLAGVSLQEDDETMDTASLTAAVKGGRGRVTNLLTGTGWVTGTLGRFEIRTRRGLRPWESSQIAGPEDSEMLARSVDMLKRLDLALASLRW